MNHRCQTDIFADTKQLNKQLYSIKRLQETEAHPTNARHRARTHFKSYVDKQGNHIDYTILYMTGNTLITENDDITNIIQQIKFVEIN